MKKRDFADMVIFFCQKVSEMNISRKYKMELLGMVTAIEIGHDQLMPKWIPVSEALPEDETICVYHVKRTVAHRIHFGGYSEKLCSFWDEMTGKWYARGDVDYWMPIPVLPKSEEK